MRCGLDVALVRKEAGVARAKKNRLFVGVTTIVAAAVAIWWLRGAWQHASETESPRAPSPIAAPAEPKPAADARPAARTEQPVAAAPAAAPMPAVSQGTTTMPAMPGEADSAVASAALAEAATAAAASNFVQARRILNAVVSPTSVSSSNEQVVQQLVKLADETLFSSRVLQNDPLVLRHSVAPKENLQKIANIYRITVPLLSRINNLSNPNAIRQGQPLKVINGPFHAVVCKSKFRVSVYCQDTLVRVFPVALGAENTTPDGTWKIKNKLYKPTYYPPRGGEMIASGDPKNPLGDYWMALEGVEGAAVGQERYGIHGTNEPDSIGKSVSMGCIRLRNEDAAQVYEMLVVRDSVVTVKE
jgi:lipoprotein-anchoring transpeptidase ErfK/SrfK